MIESLLGKQVIDIACGGSHSAAISSAGELYTWGKGRYGRLGIEFNGLPFLFLYLPMKSLWRTMLYLPSQMLYVCVLHCHHAFAQRSNFELQLN